MKDISPGFALQNGLTNIQLIQLLDTLIKALPKQQLNIIIDSLPADIGKTVSVILAGPKRSEAGKKISAAKYLETWQQLWDQWGEYVFEVGDEVGRYSYQENHWEPPYFDCETLAGDLDQVAGKMLPLLEKIAQAGEEKSTCFTEAIDEIENNIKSYPDWMSAFDHEELFVGPAVTTCLLTWEKIHAEDLASFIARLVQLEQGWRCQLDNDGFADFFYQLCEQEQKEIYQLIEDDRDHAFWKDQLASTFNNWHLVHHHLASKFSKKTYLDNCAELLDKDWRYGLPLIDDYLDKGKHREAEKIIKRLFTSFIGREQPEPWQPEKTLLLNILCYGYGNADSDICDVFKKWIIIAEKNKAARLAAALKFQAGAYTSARDWDTIAALAQDLAFVETEQIIYRLYYQWTEYTVIMTMGLGFNSNNEIDSCWLTWLLSFGLSGDSQSFLNQTGNWLSALKNTAVGKKELWSPTQKKYLRLLTQDIFTCTTGKKQYPHLYEAVRRDMYQSASMEQIRLAWLKKMKAEALFDDIIEVWKNNLENWVPDPASAEKADYSEHALWLAVAHELDKLTFNTILTSWQSKHHRRRNLWKAIHNQGLPVQ